MTTLIALGIIAGAAAVGEGAHKVLEAVTRSKEMKHAVEENNRGCKQETEHDEEAD